MTRLVLIAGLVLGSLVVAGAVASAEPALRWTPEVVRWPVDPAQLDPTPGAVPPGSSDVTGAVTIASDRAAVVWLGPATIDRVRVVRGEAAALRLRRLTGTHGARLWLDEPGVRIAAGVELVEPVGAGSLWVITAKQPLTIVVEAMQDRPARLAWEIARRDIAAWIEHDGALPALPGDDDRALALRLLGDRALVHALGKLPDRVATALRLWRLVEAEAAIAVLRRADEPYVDHSEHIPAGPSAVDERDVTFGAPAGPWQLTLEGPGSIEIEACGERPAGGWTDAIGTLEVRIDGALAAVRREPVSPALQPRGGRALPGDPAGERFGRRIRSELALGPGSHTIEIRLDGLRWVRLANLWRRPRLLDRDLTSALARARSRLAGDRSPAARAALRLLAGRTPALADAPAGLPPAVAAYVALATAPAVLPDDVARAQLDRVTPLIADARIDRALRELLAFELLDRLPDSVAADPIAALVVTWPDPPPALLAVLAPRLARGLPADASSAADRAWRRAPTSPRARAAVIEAARATRLLRLDPQFGHPFDSSDEPPVQTRWLTPGVTRPDEEPLGSLVEVLLAPGGGAMTGTLPLDVPPSPAGADRLAVLRVLAVTAPDQPGPIRIWLDGALHTTIGLQAVERIELAVAPGAHELRVEAPAGARAFIGAPGARSDHTGTIRIFHAASAARSAPRYLLPTPRAGGPIRLEVRTQYGAQVTPRTFTGWLYSDTGAPRRLVFEVSEVERDAWPLDGDARLSQAASLWLTLPPLTGRVWVTTDDPDLLVHLAVPRGRAESPPVYTGDEEPLADPLGEIEKRTLQLLANPDDAKAAIARARALLELDETVAARRDLATAASTATGADRDELALRIAQLDARVEHAYLPPQPPGSRLQAGVTLTPLPPADADLAPAIALSRSLRSGGTAGEPPANAAVIWARAGLATRAGRNHEAAALWAQLGSWQAEIAELVALTSSAYEDPERDAPVAYGLTARLTDLELPALRRARAIAYRLSRWSSISNTTASAGYERVVLPDDTSDPTPRGAVRQALVAAPWPDARILRPGHETRFSVQGPAHVKLEVWCRQLWSSSAGACAPSVQLDQHEPSRANAPHGEVTTLFDAAIEDGRHVLVVSLGPEAPESLAALRLVETDASEATPHRTKLFLALPGRPAEIVIAGPTTVAVDLRGIGATADEARGARAATVELIGERSESTRVELVAADVTGSTPLIVTAPVRHLVFVPAGTHRISVAPDRGKIAVRFARRIAARAITVPGRPVSLPLLATTLPWPVSLDPPLAEAASTQSMRIVPSIELVVGQDTLDEVDGEGVLRGTRVELAAQARTRLLDASWLGELRVRDTGDVQPTARLRLIGDLDRLPHGIDVRLDVGGALQMLSSANAWRLDATAQVERAVRLTPRLQLVPDLGLRGGLLGPELPPLDADPWIASEYRRDHPIQWIARTGVWARPFADQFALARLEADSNADLVSLDQIRATLSWRALVELSPLRGPIAYVAYQPSYRFDDADRATAYVRHDMTAQLIWSFALPRGRLGFKLWADVYAPNAFIDSWERSLGIALRWDDVGAGDRIRFGFQEPLADYLDEVTWPND